MIFDPTKITNSRKYPKWKAAVRKRIEEIYADPKTFRELMDLLWAKPLFGSVFEDTNVSMSDRDKIRVYDVATFIAEHDEHSLWSGDKEAALKCFLKLRDYVGPIAIRPKSPE